MECDVDMNVVDVKAETGYELFADLNGPLSYWGPCRSMAVTPEGRRALAPVSRVARADLARLSRTLNGRTWSGTNTLMALVLGETPAAA
jgi:hypothetical protein